jgi:hypothetical protein
MPKKTTAKKKASKKPAIKSESKSEVKPVEMSPINHFEIPFDDIERIKTFYSSIFGWQLVDMPEMDYTMVYTAPVDKNQNATVPGVVNGGFTKRNPIQKQPTLVITVNSLEKSSQQISSSGGELLGEKIDVGMGNYQLFKDPEGNILGLFEPKMSR